MKNLKAILSITILAVAMTSCKNEKQELAQNYVDSYEKYVDSVSKIEKEEAAINWVAIQSYHDKAKIDAESSLVDVEDKEVLQMDIDNSSTKYEEYKAEVKKTEAENSKTSLHRSIFGEKYVNDDMKFNWVNKDNILAVYQNFYNSIQQNKDLYSREDWDEIKLTYEALDTRKNTVEKEGISTSDNLKIAAIKVKFSSMYTVNRMGSKSEENAEAKE